MLNFPLTKCMLRLSWKYRHNRKINGQINVINVYYHYPRTATTHFVAVIALLYNVEATILNPKQVTARLTKLAYNNAFSFVYNGRKTYTVRDLYSVCADVCSLPHVCIQLHSNQQVEPGGLHSESKQHDSPPSRLTLHLRSYSAQVQQRHLPSASPLKGAHNKTTNVCQTCWCEQYNIKMLMFMVNIVTATAITTKGLWNQSLQEWGCCNSLKKMQQ